MKRKDGRALAKTTLEGLGFDVVLAYEPDTLTKPLVATVHSKSLGILQDARADFSAPAEIWVSIFVRRPSGAGETVEDLLDDLTRAAMRALWIAFYAQAADLQIGPSQAGVPERPIDGKSYRIERFAVRFNDDEE